MVIRFFTEDGTSYAIEGSTDLSVWTTAVSGIMSEGRAAVFQ